MATVDEPSEVIMTRLSICKFIFISPFLISFSHLILLHALYSAFEQGQEVEKTG
jgi:hypothetical protein